MSGCCVVVNKNNISHKALQCQQGNGLNMTSSAFIPDAADTAGWPFDSQLFRHLRSLPLQPPEHNLDVEVRLELSQKKHEVRAESNPTYLSRMRSIVSFYICYLLCLGLGLATMLCVWLWNSRWRGGFAWDGSALQFNWHPVLMVTGLLVLYGYGAVLYRVPLTWGQNKLPWKLLHAAVMLLSLVLSIVGLCAVFNFHNAKNTPNLYSLHSWIGITTTALFAIQWVMGMAGFLLPWSPVSLRKLLKPIHVWFGGIIMVLSIIACISGINEKLFFVLKGNSNGTKPYANLPPEAVLGNSSGVLIVAFGLVVLKILSNRSWQRPDSRPEDISYTPVLQEENE